MTQLSEKQRQDDIIRWNDMRMYNIVPVTVYNRTGVAITASDVMGQPLRPDSSVSGAYRFLMSTEESYCNGILLHDGGFNITNLANAGHFASKALIRGPAIINKNALPTKDVGGTNSFTLATLVTALLGLNPPILPNAEMTPTVTQST